MVAELVVCGVDRGEDAIDKYLVLHRLMYKQPF
jgi:hypothetical protein